MATATPLGPAESADSAEAARRVAQAGRATIRRRIRLPEGAGRKVSASVRRACVPDTYAASCPNREPGRILIPGDGAAGDQGLRIGLPARQWRLRNACGLSRLNDFLALWSQARMPSCNPQVTSTSVHMAKPGSASAPRGHAPL
jgi:hypothetical protein